MHRGVVSKLEYCLFSFLNDNSFYFSSQGHCQVFAPTFELIASVSTYSLKHFSKELVILKSFYSFYLLIETRRQSQMW
jgi:hypothetical protein